MTWWRKREGLRIADLEWRVSGLELQVSQLRNERRSETPVVEGGVPLREGCSGCMAAEALIERLERRLARWELSPDEKAAVRRRYRREWMREKRRREKGKS